MPRANKRKYRDSDQEESDTDGFNPKCSTRALHIKLDGGKRYAHTAKERYLISMASLQPDSRILPNCACHLINEDKRMNRKSKLNDRVTVIVEHDLKEHILCILDKNELNQCKLNLSVQPGEQIAYRTVGEIPVQLSGVLSEAHK